MGSGRTDSWRALAIVTVAALMMGAVVARVAAAPPAILIQDTESDSSEDLGLEASVFQPPKRAVLRQLSNARKLLAQNRHGEAVRYLGAILEGPQDFFFQPDNNDPVHRSLKTEAQRLIGAMPPRGHELYELQYGAAARRMLDEAAAKGDPGAISEVSRRFFHTGAGYEATMLLGLYHLDQGQPLAGALVLERLREQARDPRRFEPLLSLATATCWLQAGRPEKAKETLFALPEQSRAAPLRIAGKEMTPPAEKEAVLPWLHGLVGNMESDCSEAPSHWLMARGNPARNASSQGGAPLLNMLWRIPTSDHPLAEGILELLDEETTEQSHANLPGLRPLVVDDVVLMRTSKNLLAADFKTGKRLWEVPVDDPLDKSLGAHALLFRQPAQLVSGLRQRVLKDATYGTLSSDGQRVFSVEDLSLGIQRHGPRHVTVNNRRIENPAWPRPYNRLAAHDIHTGKLVWHIGGSPEEYGLPCAGTFFLGPPLPLGGRLYALGEVKSEIRLFCLEAASGEVLWSQQLSSAEEDILEDPLRRLVGVAPSFADGILVCPTANNAIVAVELSTQSLLWGYAYPRASRSRNHPLARAVRQGVYSSSDMIDYWVDSGVILAEGRVLATPVESDDLHCLDLLSGKLLWKQPRQADLFPACVHEGKVILVGHRHVRALNLDDGRPAWNNRSILFPEESAPSGHGFLAEEHYYIPLNTGKVLALDVNDGAVTHVSTSREGRVPGNLVCYKGRMLSQSTSGVEMFHQLDALKLDVTKRLAENPNDAEALLLGGEILLDANQRDKAIAYFRRSHELTGAPGAARHLREALLDGLAADFSRYRASIPEIQRLLTGPEERAALLRMTAAGFRETGQWSEALEKYLELAEVEADPRHLEEIDKSHSARRDRWLRAQMAGLREESPAEIRAEIDKAVAARLGEAETKSAEDLHRFLDCFGDLPGSERAWRPLVDKLKQERRFLEAESLLFKQAASADREQAAAAIAELARMLHEAGRAEDAAACYRQLAGPLADVPCFQGKTVREFVASLAPEDPVRRWLAPQNIWPEGNVIVKKETPDTPRPSSHGEFTFDYLGNPAPFFSHHSILYDQNERKIAGRDGHGREQWRIPLVAEEHPISMPFNRNLTRASASGHLLLLSMGHTMMAVDTLHGEIPEILWRRHLNEPVRRAGRDSAQRDKAVQFLWSPQYAQLLQQRGQGLGMPGVVSRECICYIQSRCCLALDGLTGEVLWIRHGVAPGSTVFGDDRMVFLVGPNESEAMVLRAADGSLLGKRRVLSESERLATFGRRILIRRHINGRMKLQMWDPWEQRALWPVCAFDANTKLQFLGEEALGLMDATGHFTLLDLDSGRLIVDASLRPEENLSEISLMKSEGQYLLVTHGQPRSNRIQRHPRNLPGTMPRLVRKGHVYAFDLEGNEMWPDPVPVEEQHLLLDQPDRLPVLVFACNMYERQPRRSRYQTSILCLDKRNGRVLVRERMPNQTSSFAIVGNPETKTVEIRLQQSTISMTFTAEPVPPDAVLPTVDPPRAQLEAAVGSLVGSLWNVTGEMSENALNITGTLAQGFFQKWPSKAKMKQ